MLKSNYQAFQKFQRHASVVFAVAAVWICATPAASAQNGQRGSNSATAALHIRINIVSAVYPKTVDTADSISKTNVVYNVHVPLNWNDSIIDTKMIEIRTKNGLENAILKTTTITPQ